MIWDIVLALCIFEVIKYVVARMREFEFSMVLYRITSLSRIPCSDCGCRESCNARLCDCYCHLPWGCRKSR
jgi:hypothetical protein